jgi:hypothetical protein
MSKGTGRRHAATSTHIGSNHDGSNLGPSPATAANSASDRPWTQPLRGSAVRTGDPRSTDATSLEDDPWSDSHRGSNEVPPTDGRRSVVEGKNGRAAVEGQTTTLRTGSYVGAWIPYSLHVRKEVRRRVAGRGDTDDPKVATRLHPVGLPEKARPGASESADPVSEAGRAGAEEPPAHDPDPGGAPPKPPPAPPSKGPWPEEADAPDGPPGRGGSSSVGRTMTSRMLMMTGYLRPDSFPEVPSGVGATTLFPVGTKSGWRQSTSMKNCLRLALDSVSWAIDCTTVMPAFLAPNK